MVFDVTTDDFDARVIERSREVPVVVDFWAEWCGPCRQLGPALERAAAEREGEVELAKLDVDANGALAARYGIRGIPAVKAFKDGRVVDEFVGAVPPARVAEFFDRLVPSEAERLAASDDEAALRKALEVDPRQVTAATRLARLLLRRGDIDEAEQLVAPFEADFTAAGLTARARLEASANGATASERVQRAFTAWDDERLADALEALQEELSVAHDPDRRDALRRVMVAIFTELGPDHSLAAEHRRRLAAALN